MDNEGKSFIDELIEEAEAKEEKLMQSHLDLILIEIRNLEDSIEKNFATAAEEREIQPLVAAIYLQHSGQIPSG